MSPLERLRRERDLDQVTLAAKAGVSQSTVSRAENGEKLTLTSALRIAAALGVPVEQLFPPAAPAVSTSAPVCDLAPSATPATEVA